MTIRKKNGTDKTRRKAKRDTRQTNRHEPSIMVTSKTQRQKTKDTDAAPRRESITRRSQDKKRDAPTRRTPKRNRRDANTRRKNETEKRNGERDEGDVASPRPHPIREARKKKKRHADDTTHAHGTPPARIHPQRRHRPTNRQDELTKMAHSSSRHSSRPSSRSRHAPPHDTASPNRPRHAPRHAATPRTSPHPSPHRTAHIPQPRTAIPPAPKRR